MDPRMDQCCGLTCSIKTEDLLMVEFPLNYDVPLALKLLQSLLVHEISYLDGASFLESTHQCIFAWEGAWGNLVKRESLVDRSILAYAKSLDRSLSHISRVVLAADVFEGEQSSFASILFASINYYYVLF
jgi:hypothetical protein